MIVRISAEGINKPLCINLEWYLDDHCFDVTSSSLVEVMSSKALLYAWSLELLRVTPSCMSMQKLGDKIDIARQYLS